LPGSGAGAALIGCTTAERSFHSRDWGSSEAVLLETFSNRAACDDGMV
jgi:hypothetical protein